jgi:hypothetical protein
VLDLDLENKAKACSCKTVQSHFPPIYKNIVHEKFHQCIKKGGVKKEFMKVKLDSLGRSGCRRETSGRGARDFSRRSASNWT